MSRTLLSALLLLMVGIGLTRDAAWPPLLNEASAENVIQAYLGRKSESARAIICDCAVPTSECGQVCKHRARISCGNAAHPLGYQLTLLSQRSCVEYRDLVQLLGDK